MRALLGQLAAAVIERAAERRGSFSEDAAATLKSVVDTLQSDYPDFAEAAALDREDGSRLARIANVFGLDEPSIRLLVAALAPELDATFGIAYDTLGGRPVNGWLSVGLGLELCAIPSAGPDAFAYLDPAAPLRSANLLEVVGESTWPRRALRVPDRVVSYVAGVDIPDPSVAAAAIEALPFSCADSSLIARALERTGALLWVRSPRGAAGASVAVAAFAETGLRCLVLDLHRAPHPAALTALVAAGVREAALAGAGLVITGGEVFAGEGGLSDDHRGALRALEQARIPVVGVGTCGWNPGWLRSIALSFDAPVLSKADRAAMWSQALEGAPDLEPGQPALSALRLTPDEVLNAARYAARLASLREEPVNAATARAAVRALSRTSAPSVASSAFSEPATFDDLVLPDRVMSELKRLVRWAAHRDEVLARGPVHGKGDQGDGISALFTGGPGTGKTLSAHVIAGELGLELLQVELPSIVDKYIGETEKNLERVFHEAEQRNVVLFFDEADALFGSRSEVKDARDRYANQEVAYLLQRMEHFSGITLLATNLRGNLDKAFSRRMHFIIHFPDPDENTRRQLWTQLLGNAGVLDDRDPVDIDVLSTSGDLNGGDIRNVVLAATYDAASEGSLTGMRHVLAAKEREFRKLGRRPSTT
ncbi:MAG: ATP-binding protein [Actinomycetota bacterium]|nr:ATP-binding protein [Actinomycetota bacterium]